MIIDIVNSNVDKIPILENHEKDIEHSPLQTVERKGGLWNLHTTQEKHTRS